MSQEAATPAAPATSTWLSRWFKALGIVILVGLVPAILVGFWMGPVAAMAVPFGLMGGVFASTGGDGRNVAMKLFPLIVVGGAISAATAGTYWWVLLLLVLGGLIGRLSAAGRAVAVIEVCIVVVTADRVESWEDLIKFTVFFALGYLAGVFLGRLAGAPDFTEAQPFTHINPIGATLLGAASLAIAGAIALAVGWEDGKGYWLPMVFLIMLEFYLVNDEGTDRRMVVYRLLGTILGIAVLLPLVPELPVLGQVAAFAGLAAAGIATSDARYWLSAAFVTAAVVLVTSIGSDPTTAANERLWATLVAFVLVGAVAFAMQFIRIKPPVRS